MRRARGPRQEAGLPCSRDELGGNLSSWEASASVSEKGCAQALLRPRMGYNPGRADKGRHQVWEDGAWRRVKTPSNEASRGEGCWCGESPEPGEPGLMLPAHSIQALLHSSLGRGSGDHGPQSPSQERALGLRVVSGTEGKTASGEVPGSTPRQ